jgi:hypothetical protein
VEHKQGGVRGKQEAKGNCNCGGFFPFGKLRVRMTSKKKLTTATATATADPCGMTTKGDNKKVTTKGEDKS